MPDDATETRIDCVNNVVGSSPLSAFKLATAFLNQPAATTAPLMLKVVIMGFKVIPQEHSHLVEVKTGLLRNVVASAFIISGITVRFWPIRFGKLIVPKGRSFLQILIIVNLLISACSAI